MYGTVPYVYGAVGEVACGEMRVAPSIGRLVGQEAARGNHEECICVFCVSASSHVVSCENRVLLQAKQCWNIITRNSYLVSPPFFPVECKQ